MAATHRLSVLLLLRGLGLPPRPDDGARARRASFPSARDRRRETVTGSLRAAGGAGEEPRRGCGGAGEGSRQRGREGVRAVMEERKERPGEKRDGVGEWGPGGGSFPHFFTCLALHMGLQFLGVHLARSSIPRELINGDLVVDDTDISWLLLRLSNLTPASLPPRKLLHIMWLPLVVHLTCQDFATASVVPPME
ncbi:hypothetical protein U9M48_029466 [Paspalum notatum var. saurae]|uniref:Uncharacterized protein n=1 Tax=Paspalum notatum var. saurae TaxID=547442 RepID=A0AAQ3U321_PASNO